MSISDMYFKLFGTSLENKEISNNKEQINGLEALGDVVKEGSSDAPMDNPEENPNANEEKVKPSKDVKDTKENPMEDAKPSEDDSNAEDDSTDNNEGNPSDGDTGDGEDGNSMNEPSDPSQTTSDDGAPSEDLVSEDDKKDLSKDPNFAENRRILLSNKLLKLFDSIKDSMNDIANGPSFSNKPVIIEELSELSDSVQSIIIGINKEPDHKVLLMRYAVCVKIYNRIIRM